MHPSIIDTSPKFAIGDEVKIQTSISNIYIPRTTIVEVIFMRGGEPTNGTFGRCGATRGWHYVCEFQRTMAIREQFVFPLDPPEDKWVTEFKEKMKPQPVSA